MDLGDPGSYLTLEEGTPVYGSDRVEVGPDEVVARDRGDKLRRAWLRISGKS
jgi:hypothetical protein